MENTINWGILAPGRIARKFANDLNLLPQARLHAVASRAKERAEEFTDTFPAQHAYGSYEELAGCPGLDVVYVASPHTGHHEHSLMLLEAGIPVLCEKPFAVNLGQVKEMVELARAKDIFLMEALWTRFLPSFQKAEEIIASGKIGKVVSIKADFGFVAQFDPKGRLFNPKLAGGALLDIGIYPVFLALQLMGKPDEIRSFAKLASTGVDEEIGLLFRYDTGQMAHLHATLRSRTKTEAFIYGEKGSIQLHTRWHEADRFTLAVNGEEKTETFAFDMPGTGYQEEAKEVMECLLAGRKESQKLPLSFSLDLMEVLDDIRREAGIRYPMD